MSLPGVFPTVSKKKSSILEEVQFLVRENWGNEKLREYLEALGNKEAVTGSVVGDHIFAADLIRTQAAKTGLAMTASAKQAEIARCMQTVLRRVGLSQSQRRLAVPVAAE